MRPRMAECIIQRDAGIDTAESALRLAMVALVAGGEELIVAAVHVALVAATGAAPIDIAVKPFYPEHFFVICGSQATCDRVLATNPLPVHPAKMTLLPWTHVAHADLSVLWYKVRLEIEGIPPHVWLKDTAAKLLAPSCWIAEVNEATATTADLSSYRLSAWTRDPSAIPTEVRLVVAENEVASGVGGVRF